MKKVLICDDSLLIRKKLKDYFEKKHPDFQVAQASNGHEALRLYQSDSFSFVLLDIVMPELDGIGCIRELKQFDPGVAVVVLSSVGNKETLREALNAGAVDFIQKPWSEKMLDRIVDAYR